MGVSHPNQAQKFRYILFLAIVLQGKTHITAELNKTDLHIGVILEGVYSVL